MPMEEAPTAEDYSAAATLEPTPSAWDDLNSGAQRVTDRAENLLPGMLNDMIKLQYNVGLGGDSPPPLIPLPHSEEEMGPPKNWGEQVTDIGMGLAKAAPEIVLPELAAGRVAESLQLGKMATSVIKGAAGFGTQGATESPEEGVTQAAIGGSFGLADVLPAKGKAIIASALGLFTAAKAKLEGKSNTQAVTEALINASIPVAGEGINLLQRLRGKGQDVLEVAKDASAGDATAKPVVDNTTNQSTPASTSNTAQGEVATLQINKSNRLTMQSVMHHDDPIMLQKAADKLGIKYDGTMGEGDQMQLRFTDPTGPSFNIAPGDTYADLKDARNKKLQEINRPATADEQAVLDKIATRKAQNNPAIVSSAFAGHGELGPVEPIATLQPGTLVDHENMGQAKVLAPTATTAAGETRVKFDNGVVTDVKSSMLKPAESAEVVPPSPSETRLVVVNKRQSGEVTPVVGGLETGTRVQATIEGQSETAHVLPSTEPGLVKVRTIDGYEYDLPPSRVKSFTGAKEAESLAASLEKETPQVATIGGLDDLARQADLPKTGMKLRNSHFTEGGFLSEDAQKVLLRYGAPMIVGGTVGAISDPDHRLYGAMMGAAAMGLVGRYGPDIFKFLKDGHPNVGPSFAKTVSKKVTSGSVTTSTLDLLGGLKAAGHAVWTDVRDLSKALIADPAMAAKANKQYTQASGFDRLAKFMQEQFTTDPAVKRILDRAWGEVEEMGNSVFEKAFQVFSREPEMQNIAVKDAIKLYWDGTITHGELEKRVGNTTITDAAAMAHQARGALQKAIIDGMADGKLKQTVINSVDKYLKTGYEFFTNPKFRPDDNDIIAYAKTLDKKWGDLDHRIDIVQDYLRQVRVNKSLIGRYSGTGAKLGAILQRSKDLPIEFQTMMGKFTDPVIEMGATAVKLIQGSKAARFFDIVSGATKENGLKMAYDTTEHQVTIATLQNQIKRIQDPAKLLEAQTTLRDLKNYMRADLNPTFGKLAGKWVDQRVHDQLNHLDQMFSHNPVGQTMADITNAIKYGHTVLSPFQTMRQFMSIPMLGMMAKTLPQDWYKAWNMLRDTSPQGLADNAWLTRLGIRRGDIISGQFRQDMQSLMQGKVGKMIYNNPAGQMLKKFEEIHRFPDLVVRAAAFLKEHDRLIGQVKQTITPAIKEEIENKAIDYANKWSINYGQAPRGIRTLRQIPFMNQYLTFAEEIARITKNHIIEASKGDMTSIGVLAGLIAAPMAIAKMSEHFNLSERDRDDWEKTKALMPDYKRDDLFWVHGRNQDGTFRTTNFTPILIEDHAIHMLQAFAHGDMDAFQATNPLFGWQNTPLLTSAASQISGQDVHTGEKFHGVIDRAKSVIRDVAPTFPLGTDLDKWSKALTPNAEGGLGITNQRTGQTQSWQQVLMDYVTATRGGTYNLNVLENQAISKAKADIMDRRMQLRRVLSTNLTTEAKQHAIDQFQQESHDTLATLQSKLSRNTLQGNP